VGSVEEGSLVEGEGEVRGDAGAVTPSREGPPARTCSQSDSCRAPTGVLRSLTRSVTFLPSELTKRVRTFIFSTSASRAREASPYSWTSMAQELWLPEPRSWF